MKQLEILSKNEEKSFNRTKISGKIVAEGVTSSRKAVCEALAKNLKVPVETVIVKKIKTSYGSTMGTFEAYIYDSNDSIKKFENSYVIKRHKHLMPAKIEGEDNE